jgi:hypothetical protein
MRRLRIARLGGRCREYAVELLLRRIVVSELRRCVAATGRQPARRVLTKLRQRVGEAFRPHLELDYIERPLEDYSTAANPGSKERRSAT